MVNPGSKSSVYMEVDDNQVWKTFIRFQQLAPEGVREVLTKAMEIIGLHSVTKYMKVRAVVDTATGQTEARKDPGEALGIATGRLSRSIMGKESAQGGNEYIRRITLTGKNIVAEMGSQVPYAAIHEKGGQAGRGGSVYIPARPYLEPAAKDKETEIFMNMKIKMELTVRAAEGI